MSDLVGNPEDRFSRVAAHICHIVVKSHLAINSVPEKLLSIESEEGRVKSSTQGYDLQIHVQTGKNIGSVSLETSRFVKCSTLGEKLQEKLHSVSDNSQGLTETWLYSMRR